MTINSQNSQLWVSQQISGAANFKVTGAFTPSATANYQWRALPALTIQGGIQQVSQQMPLEVSGALVPTGAFKSGTFFAAEVDLIPRLKYSFGHLLKMTMGYSTGLPTTNITGQSGTTGVNQHLFSMQPLTPLTAGTTAMGVMDDTAAVLPWFAVRKAIDTDSTANDFAEYGYNCKAAGLRFTVQSASKIAAKLSVIGAGTFIQRGSAGAPTVATPIEDYLTTLDSGQATIFLDGVQYPLLSLTVDIQNDLTGPEEEFVLGSYYLDDIIPKARAITVRAILKVNNTNFYQGVLGGTTAATTWSEKPWQHESLSGSAQYALDARFKSSALIGASTEFHELRFYANRVTWTATSPPMQAGNILTQEIVGIVQQPFPVASTSGAYYREHYFVVAMVNNNALSTYNS